MEVQSIVIVGKRWFQKSYGNTYCSAVAYVNGKPLVSFSKVYGYGDYYLQYITELLEKEGYLPGIEKYEWGGMEAIWRYCERSGIEFSYTVSDVSREKDL